MEFDTLELLTVPFAGLHARIGLGNKAGGREHQREGVLRGRDRIAAGGIHDDDAVFGGRIDVDIVDADACTADDLEILGGFKDGRGHLGLATDHQSVELGNDLDQLLFLEAGLDNNFHDSSLGKGFDSAGGDGICDKDFGNGAHDEEEMWVG